MMRILFALAGLHRVDRGAEVALIAVATELQGLGHEVTLIGSGPPRPDASYRYLRAPAIKRERFERWPRMPVFRSDTAYEESSFALGLLLRYRPSSYDVTVTCSYPFTNWLLSRGPKQGGRPKHVFVTQNGDWPAASDRAEYRWFGCDGLVCTNPEYLNRNRSKWRSTLIPNGIDVGRFDAATSSRERLGIALGKKVVLMVSALIPSKRVACGIRAVSKLPNTELVVAGDGPLRAEIDALAAELLPGRFTRLSLKADEMPQLYRSCDVFLHLSSDESFGNVYLEASAAGLPTVAIDTAHTRWILGDDQFFTKSNNPDEVADCLGPALIASDKPRTRAKHIEDFSWPKIARLYELFFQDILASEGRLNAH